MGSLAISASLSRASFNRSWDSSTQDNESLVFGWTPVRADNHCSCGISEIGLVMTHGMHKAHRHVNVCTVRVRSSDRDHVVSGLQHLQPRLVHEVGHLAEGGEAKVAQWLHCYNMEIIQLFCLFRAQRRFDCFHMTDYLHFNTEDISIERGVFNNTSQKLRA